MKTDHFEPRNAYELSFLSHDPVLNVQSHTCYTGKLSYEKLVASLFRGGQDFTFLGDLRRLVGLRQVGWTNERFRKLSEFVLSTLVPLFPLWKGDPEFEAIMMGWKSDSDLFRLWHS
jgi:hypothetical protein